MTLNLPFRPEVSRASLITALLRSLPSRPAATFALIILLTGPACVVEVVDATACSGTDIETPDGFVTVRFRNLTASEAVDVQFYATNERLENWPEDLFDPAYLVTTSIGVAGTGIIRPSQVDIIELPCSDGLTIGTLGGSFVDDESGEPRGVGVPRWAQDGPLPLCNNVVTFDYTSNEGVFSTALSIGQ